MTVSELEQLLVAKLVRDAGGSQRQWRLALGRITLHDMTTHPHCNWSIAPRGNARENELIETMLDDVRLRHPLVVA
jgi:hypothetical protein